MTTKLPQFPTPHCHQASFDSAGTPEGFAQRELELGSGYSCVTDHGSMAATRQVYDLAIKNKLNPIIGLEAYLRDDLDPILLGAGVKPDAKGTLRDYASYFHITMHALDQAAFAVMVRVLSRADLSRTEKHGSESKPLFTWADLEEIGAANVTMTSGCLGGVVQTHLVRHNNVPNAIAYYEKARSLVKPGNFLVEVFPHACTSNWGTTSWVIWEDGVGLKDMLPAHKQFRLQNGDKIKLKDLARRYPQGRIPVGAVPVVAMMNNRVWVDCAPRNLVGIHCSEGFQPNECRPWCPDGDLQQGCNRFMIELASRYGDPVIISDDAHFPSKSNKIAQDIRLGGGWRFGNSYHRQTSQEAFEHFQKHNGVDLKTFTGWLENNQAWAHRFDGFRLNVQKSLPTRFYPEDSLAYTRELIKKHGRMDWGNRVWVDRLKQEIEMFHNNGTLDLLPYFFPVEEVVSLYEKNGQLTGPGRGSAAGVLLTYLLGITHIDPVRYGLSLERFLTKSRINSGKLPDIDQDLNDRDLILGKDNSGGWLRERFGDCFAQISTNTKLRLSSSVLDVARAYPMEAPRGFVPDEIKELSKRFERAPQGVEDHDFVFGYHKEGTEEYVPGSLETDPALQQYVQNYPGEWEIVQQVLGFTRQKSKHACGVVITNNPISSFMPLTVVADGPCTAYTAASVEAMGCLKYDFLRVNSIQDIMYAIRTVQERYCGGLLKEAQIVNGKRVPGIQLVPVPGGGGYADIWDLPEDQKVFRDFCEGRTETVFQFNTPSARQWLKEFNHTTGKETDGVQHKSLDSILALAAFTALDRPGPLNYFVEDDEGGRHNMLVEYARRARGEKPVGNIPTLDEILPETRGVIIFQESLQKIFQHIGHTSAEEADEFRVHISKKQKSKVEKDRAVFMRGAKGHIDEKEAQAIWDQLEVFSDYGFSLNHAVPYVDISYACAYLKHHYPLEWWVGVLRNADKDEVNQKFWGFCGHLIDLPDIVQSQSKFEIQGERIRAPLDLLLGIGDKANTQLQLGRPYKDIDDFCQKVQAFKEAGRVAVLGPDGKQVLVTRKGKGRGANKLPDTVEPKWKMGSSALNKTVVCTLIMIGSMDSLFPPDTTTAQKIDLYLQASARAAGDRNPEKPNAKFLNANAMDQYQMKKSVLPAFSEKLLPLIKPYNPPQLFVNPHTGRTCWRTGKDSDGNENQPIGFVSLREIEAIEVVDPWPYPDGLPVAVAAYIISERPFVYQGNKQAIEYVLDVGDGQMKVVRWPARGQKKPPKEFNEPRAGSVVVAELIKFKMNRPFALENITVIKPALNNKKEGESDGE